MGNRSGFFGMETTADIIADTREKTGGGGIFVTGFCRLPHLGDIETPAPAVY
jgi:hypothetical protein